jgi:hypothetical protein
MIWPDIRREPRKFQQHENLSDQPIETNDMQMNLKDGNVKINDQRIEMNKGITNPSLKYLNMK